MTTPDKVLVVNAAVGVDMNDIRLFEPFVGWILFDRN